MDDSKRDRARAWTAVVAVAVACSLVAPACSGDGGDGASGRVGSGTPTSVAARRALDDESMAALQATKDATSFVVEIDVETDGTGPSWPRQSLRYTAPYTFESTDPANPMLVVDGVQYDHLPAPPSGAVVNPGAYVALPLSPTAGGPLGVPFFLDLLDPASGYGGPGYRIVEVESDGTHATVVRAENVSDIITLRFSDFDAPTTPPTAPTNTAPTDGP